MVQKNDRVWQLVTSPENRQAYVAVELIVMRVSAEGRSFTTHDARQWTIPKWGGPPYLRGSHGYHSPTLQLERPTNWPVVTLEELQKMQAEEDRRRKEEADAVPFDRWLDDQSYYRPFGLEERWNRLTPEEQMETAKWLTTSYLIQRRRLKDYADRLREISDTVERSSKRMEESFDYYPLPTYPK